MNLAEIRAWNAAIVGAAFLFRGPKQTPSAQQPAAARPAPSAGTAKPAAQGATA